MEIELEAARHGQAHDEAIGKNGLEFGDAEKAGSEEVGVPGEAAHAPLIGRAGEAVACQHFQAGGHLEEMLGREEHSLVPLDCVGDVFSLHRSDHGFVWLTGVSEGQLARVHSGMGSILKSSSPRWMATLLPLMRRARWSPLVK